MPAVHSLHSDQLVVQPSPVAAVVVGGVVGCVVATVGLSVRSVGKVFCVVSAGRVVADSCVVGRAVVV
jgi:hypothetical protein